MQYGQDGSSEPRIFLAEPVINNEQDCLIILANDQMMKWAREFVPGRVLVMDTTFGTNRYGFSLLVMLAVDERGKGLPVCFAIMMHEDAASFEKVLQVFKQALNEGGEGSSNLQPASILTDDSAANQKAASSVFPYAVQGLCLYHVRAALQQQLQGKTSGRPAERAEAYHAMEKGLVAIMYMKACDTEEQTLALASKMLDEWCTR